MVMTRKEKNAKNNEHQIAFRKRKKEFDARMEAAGLVYYEGWALPKTGAKFIGDALRDRRSVIQDAKEER